MGFWCRGLSRLGRLLLKPREELGCLVRKSPSRLILCPLSAPSFLRELSDETVVLGQSVTLACQVLAQPTAQATWSKGKELSQRLGAELVRTSSNHSPSGMLWLSWGKPRLTLL